MNKRTAVPAEGPVRVRCHCLALRKEALSSWWLEATASFALVPRLGRTSRPPGQLWEMPGLAGVLMKAISVLGAISKAGG